MNTIPGYWLVAGLHPTKAGAFAHGGVVVGYVWIMEFVGPNSRSWVGAHYLSIFSIGFAFLSLVGYFARDWHDMQIWESLQLKFFVIFIGFLNVLQSKTLNCCKLFERSFSFVCHIL